MLSRATERLVVEVFHLIKKEAGEKAEKNPEACLISMLRLIKEELRENYGRAPVSDAIELASYDGDLEEAMRLLEETSLEV